MRVVLKIKVNEKIMKKSGKIFVATVMGLLLTGCGLYDKYTQTVEAPADVFGTDAADSSESLAQIPWREFFKDDKLQTLVEQVLSNNVDLNSARIAVEKSEASLKVAKMGYAPTLSFVPQGTLSKFGDRDWSKTYNLPLQLSVDVDAFGAITAKKRASKAALMQVQVNEEAVRTNLISTTAQQYFRLMLLDRQLDILTLTDSLWNASLETQKALFENGKTYSTAVNSLESSYLSVKMQLVDTRRDIRSTENAICRLLGVAPQHIDRSKWSGEGRYHSSADHQLIFNDSIQRHGVPAKMLELRPDIRKANHAMEEAFYNTKAARAAFFPSITLSGSAGWTNSGGMVVNPGKLLVSAIGTLTQPILARGRLKANHQIAKLTEEDLQKRYVQTVINAGNQVNEALSDCQQALEKHGYYHRQVEVLYEAYLGSNELMDNGKANYLEVLTAQENLLKAQLSEAQNMYKGAIAVISLYIALGGGVN